LGAIYLDHVRGRKRSHDIDERYVRIHIIPEFGKLRLNQVKQNDVTAWLARKITEEGYAKATVNRLQVILSCMFKLAKRSKMPGADQNPLEGVPLLNPDNERERFLSREEVQRLREAVEASENSQLKHIVGLLLLTGARKRELLDAKWEDFDLPRNAWRFRPQRQASLDRYH
jgi:integrase